LAKGHSPIPQFKVYKGINEILTRWNDEKIPIAIFTNWTKV